MKRVAWNFESVKISIHCLKKIRCLQLAENLAFGIYYQIGQMQ